MPTQAGNNTFPVARSGLLIGTRGWQYTEWTGHFYPDDIPPEWQLGYYSNECQTVLLPEQVWLDARAEEALAWHEDVGEQFRFFIELSTITQWQRCVTQLEAIRDQVAGIVLRSTAGAADRVDEELLESVLGLSKFAPVCLSQALRQIVLDLAPDQLAVLGARLGTLLEMTISDTPAHQIPDDTAAVDEIAKTGPVVCVVERPVSPDPRSLRMLLDACHAASAQASVAALLFAGTSPDIAAAQQAMRLQELML